MAQPSLFPPGMDPLGGSSGISSFLFPRFMNPLAQQIEIFGDFFIEVEDPEIFVMVNENW